MKPFSLFTSPMALMLLLALPHVSAEEILFEEVDQEQGLSQTVVICMAQDQQGFMWFGTQFGLNRFDGYDFVTYGQNTNDGSGLDQSYISALLVDQDGALWVGTRKGLYRRDRTGHFHRVKHHISLKSSVNMVKALIRDQDGVLWAGGGVGMFKVNETAFTLESFELLPGVETSVGAFSQDQNGNLWIGTLGTGLFIRKEGRIEHIRSNPDTPNGLVNDTIYSTLRTQNNEIWLGTDKGVSRTMGDGKFRNYVNDPNQPNSLPMNQIRSLMEDHLSRIWLGTYGGGVAVYTPGKEGFQTYSVASGLINPFVLSLFQDQSGVVWTGLYGMALCKYTPFKQQFRSYLNSGVWSMADDASGDYWAGYVEGGLVQFGPDNVVDAWYRNNPADPKSLNSNNVTALYQPKEEQDKLWVGTQLGFSIFHKKRRTFEQVPTVLEEGDEIRQRFVKWLYEEDGVPMVGTSGGIFRYHAPSETLGLSELHSAPVNLPKLNVPFLQEDSWGRLWMGSRSGLFLVNRERNGFITFLPDPEDPQSLSNNAAVSFCEHSNGDIWIGTYGGVNLWNGPESGFTRYTGDDGLKYQTIASMLEDPYGDLWLGTLQGLVRMRYLHEDGTRLAQPHFKFFNKQDGLSHSEFNVGAAYQTRDGKLLFGNVRGVTGFFSQGATQNLMAPQTSLTRFLMLNHAVAPGPDGPLFHTIERTRSLNLSHNQNYLAFEFSALHYASPKDNRYAYKLEGFRPEWFYTDASQRRAQYTNLGSGKYVFRVKASNADGVWDEMTPLQVHIKPPLWRTWWAMVLYVLLLVLLIAWYMKAQTQKLRRQEQAAEREREIANQLREVDKLKDQFLANTSHELRTPLHGMIGLAEALMEEEGEQIVGSRQDLGMIVSSGRRLSALVDDILDFSKLRGNHLKLTLKPVDLHAMVEIALTLSRPLARDRDLVLTNDVNPQLKPVHGDEHRLQQILHNLIGNALKFTPSGEVKITANLEEDGWVTVAVHDTGPGIPLNNQATIFQSFQQLDGDADRRFGGAGLGLSITRGLVELHGGRIWVESQPGEGSVFLFTLPISSERPEPKAPEIVAGGEPAGGAPVSRLNMTLNEDAPDETSLEIVQPKGVFRILLVDDEPVNRRVLARQLTLRNYHLDEAVDGPQALRLLEKKDAYDLVLLDIMMPGLSGYQVCEKLRQHYSSQDLPVIFLTARNRVDDLVAAFNAGGNDFVTKPVAREELLSRVGTHLELLDMTRNLEHKVSERTTELRLANQTLDARNQEILAKQAQLVMQAKMASLGTLTAGVAHELNNPLNFVNNYAEVAVEICRDLGRDLQEWRGRVMDGELFEDLTAEQNSLQESSERIRVNGSRASSIVRSMMELSASGLGDREPVDLHKLLDEFVALSATEKLKLADRTIRIRKEFGVGDPVRTVFPRGLARVFINLIHNALEALTEKSFNAPPDFQPELLVFTRYNQDGVEIGFRDNGPGVSLEERERIFTPFHTTKPQGSGHIGLGLSLSFDIITQGHGGQLVVESEQGVFTEMRVILPGK